MKKLLLISTILVSITLYFFFDLILSDSNSNDIKKPNIGVKSFNNWLITFDVGKTDFLYKGVISRNGNLYMVGHNKKDAYNGDSYILKLNADGNVLWYRYLTGEKGITIESLAIDSNEKTFLIGYSNSYGFERENVIILGLDSNGSLLWSKFIGEEWWDYGTNIVMDHNYNIYILGITYSYGDSSGHADTFLAKLDSGLEILWFKTFGGPWWELGTKLAIDSTGDIIIAGYVYGYTGNNFDIFVSKVASDGNLKWFKVIGGFDNDTIWGLTLDSLDNIYICGTIENIGIGQEDVFISKIDSDGNLLWSKAIGGYDNDAGYSIKYDNAGNLYAVGYTESFGVGSLDALVMKLDIDGNIIWAKTVGSENKESFLDIELDDKYIYLIGTTEAYEPGNLDSLIIKIDKHYLANLSNSLFAPEEETRILARIRTWHPGVYNITPTHRGYSYQTSTKIIVYDSVELTIKEPKINTHIAILDSDLDHLPDEWESRYNLNPFDPSDANIDNDNDSLSNFDEYKYGTNPCNNDTDNDGMPDNWEISYGLNATDPNDANLDYDNDELTNREEYTYQTDPIDNDTDDDGLTDSEEIYRIKTDPNDCDTDGDGMNDRWEVEYHLDPLDPNDRDLDIDGDNLTNFKEYNYGTNPLVSDTDGDGLIDGEEILMGTNPLSWDSDWDLFKDDVDPLPTVNNWIPIFGFLGVIPIVIRARKH